MSARGSSIRRSAWSGVLLLAAWAAGAATSVAASPAAKSARDAADPAAPPDFSRQVIITLPAGPERLWTRVTQDLATVFSLKPLFQWPLSSIGEQCLVFELPAHRTAEDLAKRLAGDRRIASVQPVRLFATQSREYNDPYAHLQAGVALLRLRGAHDLATGKGVKVAVVDTGVDLSHPDLVDRIVKANNFVTWGEPAFTGDVHGTAVAGALAAGANNHVGIVGVAPAAEVLALKACWQAKAESRQAQCNSYTLAQALDFAIREGVQVINVSLTGPSDALLSRLLAVALERGIAVVAARPEDSSEGGFPASEPGVVAVAALRAGEVVQSPSPSLPVKDGPSEITGPRVLVAPGVDILSTRPAGGYDFFSGSSFAAAQASGVLALLLERKPGLKPAELAALLEQTARPVVQGSGAGLSGTPRGLIDACSALARLGGGNEPCPD